MKKVLIDARHLKSGIGQYTKSILRYIHEFHVDEKFEIHVMGNREELRELYPRFTIHHSTTKIYSIKEQIDFLKYSKLFDLFHAPHYNIPIFFSGKLLVTIHDVIHLTEKQHKKNPIKQLYAKFFFKVIKIKAYKIVTVSNYSKEEIVRNTGIAEDKIQVIYNGYETESSPDYNGTGLIPMISGKYILFVGNLKPHKNISGMVEGFLKFKERYNLPYSLVLAGMSETNHFKVDKNIHILGFVSREQLLNLYKGATLHILLSFFEGFGIPPLEALSHGIPTLVSDIPAFREIYGTAAIFCNPYNTEEIAEKIYLAVSDDKKRENCLFAGKALLQKYSWKRAASGVYKIYEEMLFGGW